MPFLLYSYLTDREFLKHLLTKNNPTDEDVEAALRIEKLLDRIEDLEGSCT